MISSKRLDLVEIPLEVHVALNAGDVDHARSLVGYSFSDDWPATVPSWRRQSQLEADPNELPWLVRAIVLRAQARAIGAVGFHESPVEGKVEIGYQVLEAQRRSGYATEAIAALRAWAGRNGAVSLVASISPGNAASNAIAAQLGLVKVGEQMDEIDGLEYVFEGPI